MASDYYIGRRFRAINDWAGHRARGTMAGWPNFHQANYNDGRGTVYGHLLLRDAVVDWRDVRASEYRATNMRTRFTGAHDYATRNGYQHGFPNFHEANYGQGVVYGTFLIVPGTCQWRDVPASQLGIDPRYSPMDAWIRGANDYAGRNGFAAGLPNGHYANYGSGFVCGVFLFPHGKAEWVDIPGREIGFPDPAPQQPQPQPAKTTVPNVVGLLSSQASPAITAARLRVGQVWNATGEYRSDRLRVAAQDPAPGTQVNEQSTVNYRVELAQQQQGIKSIQLTNRHQNGRAVEIHVFDSSMGRWESKGNLAFNATMSLSLSSFRVYTVVAVDRGLVNCTDGRPDNVSCQRLVFGARGDTMGITVPIQVS